MIKLEFVKGAQRLSEGDRDLAAQICGDTDRELRTLLPTLIDVVNVRIAMGPRVIPQFGYGASAMTLDSVSFVLDPSHAGGSAKILHTHLRPALFHECHHLVRKWVKLGGKRRKHFIEGVICEGLATAFERDAAGSSPLWSEYPDNVQDWVDELLTLPPQAPYADWMFFHPNGRRWIGYRAGTFIADLAIAASGCSAADLAEVDYQEILAFAGQRFPQPA